MRYTPKVGMKLRRIKDPAGNMPVGAIVEVVASPIVTNIIQVNYKGDLSWRSALCFEPAALESEKDMEALYE